MEVIESENVMVPKSLFISGLSQTTADEEIFNYLKQYGSIARVIKVAASGDEPCHQAIVEFVSGTAVEALQEEMPFDRPCAANPDIVHHVDAMVSVYSSENGRSITCTFLSLKAWQNLAANHLSIFCRTS